MKKWSIIIFSYNEESTIVNVIINAATFINQCCSLESEIIFINDGSTDNSQTIVENIKNQIPFLKIINLSKNHGIGYVLNLGYNLVKGEYICAIPGDGQFDINELYQIKEIPEGRFISFYRKNKNYGIYRTILNYGNYYFNKYLLEFDIKDVNWVKIYTNDQINSITRTLKSSLVESEIVFKLLKLGYKPLYFSSNYIDRQGGVPKGGNYNTLSKALLDSYKLKKLANKL